MMQKPKSNFHGDLFGGLTAAIVALPLSIAFGIVSGLGPAAGLYGAILLGFFAALFGGTPTNISGPTGPMTVVSAVVIADLTQAFGSTDKAMGPILLTFLLAGLFQILFGFSRIGQSIRYVPYSVISGFMSGIGVIIILLQLYPVIGHSTPPSILHVITQIHTIVPFASGYSIALVALTVSIIYGVPRFTQKVPSQLIALLIGTGITMIWDIPVNTIGDIPAGLPELHLSKIFDTPFFSHFEMIIFPALTLAALGSIDALLSSIIADNLTKTRHNSNSELIGQGIGNGLSALFGGIPGAAANMRTFINIKSGGRTRLSGMLHAIFLLVIVLALHDYATQIPMPVLAGILITVGIGIIDYKGIKNIFNIPLSDALVMIIVFIMTVFVDVLQAVIAGSVLSSLLFMKKMSDLNNEKTKGMILKTLLDDQPWPDEIRIPDALSNQVYIKHLYGPLFFGFSNQFIDIIQNMPEVKVIIFRMEEVPYIDQSGLMAMEEALLQMQERDVQVYFTGLQAQPLSRMERVNIIPYLVAKEDVYPEFTECLKRLSLN